MKLSTIIAKLTSTTSHTTRILAAAVLATAAFTAAAPSAHAQHLAVGVHIGGPIYGGAYYAPAPRYVVPVAPRYVGPVYGPAYGPAFYAPRFREDWREREYHERHEDLRDRRGYARPY